MNKPIHQFAANCVLSISALITTLLLGLAGCTAANQQRPTPTPLPALVSPEKVVFTVERGPITSQRESYGEIVPAWQDALFFRASGSVVRVTVKEGDQVKQGDLMAEYQVDDVLDQLQQARLDLQVAQDNYENGKLLQAYEIQKAESEVLILQIQIDQANRQIERLSGSQREDAEDTLAINQERLKIALAWLAVVKGEKKSADQVSVERNQLTVDRLERLVAEQQIVAPYDCIVLDSYLRPGITFDAFSTAFVVGDPSELVIRISYDNELSNLLEPATEAFMSLTRSKEQLYPVKYLPEFLPVSNKQGGLDISGADLALNYLYFSTPETLPLDQLPLGGGVTMVMVLGQKEDALLLPPVAIRGTETFKYVIVLDDDLEGGPHRRVEVVSIGLKGDKLWEVIADLQAGDQVLGP